MLENTISTKKKPRNKRNYYKYNEELKGEGQTEARPLKVSRSDWKLGNQRDDCPSDPGNTCILQKTLRSLMANSQKGKNKKSQYILKKKKKLTKTIYVCIYKTKTKLKHKRTGSEKR